MANYPAMLKISGTARLVFCFCLVGGFVVSPNALAEELDAKGWADRGSRYESEKRLSLAISCFGKAIEADPDFGEAYFTRSGLLISHKEDYAGAVADLTQYLRLHPNNYSGLFNRGLYRTQLRDFDGAIADYTQVLEPDTDFSNFGESADKARAHALHYRGRIYDRHKQDPKQAVADYTEALKLDPSIDRLYYRRAVAHQELKNYEAANRDFKVAMEREPSFHQLRDAWAWHLATCPIKEFRSGKHAIIMAKSPGTIAAALAEMGQFKQAIVQQEKAIAAERQIQATAKKKDDTRLSKLQTNLERLRELKPIRD